MGTERLRTTYNGGVEGTFTSLPWGDGPPSGTGSDLDANHYATLDHDTETGTDHAQFRQYSNTQGRWLSPDPYSGSYDASNPQSFNRYAYAMNSPLSYVDPSGLDTCGTEDGFYDYDASCGAYDSGGSGPGGDVGGGGGDGGDDGYNGDSYFAFRHVPKPEYPPKQLLIPNEIWPNIPPSETPWGPHPTFLIAQANNSGGGGPSNRPQKQTYEQCSDAAYSKYRATVDAVTSQGPWGDILGGFGIGGLTGAIQGCLETGPLCELTSGGSALPQALIGGFAGAAGGAALSTARLYATIQRASSQLNADMQYCSSLPN